MDVSWISNVMKTTIFLKAKVYKLAQNLANYANTLNNGHDWLKVMEQILCIMNFWQCVHEYHSKWIKITRVGAYEVECTDCTEAFPSVASESVFFVPQCGQPDPKKQHFWIKGSYIWNLNLLSTLSMCYVFAEHKGLLAIVNKSSHYM